jgi:uncharacterized membrane protein
VAGIDWLRGLVMALMVIDHTRDFMHAESFWHRATDLSVISSATFLTRWVTHFCAPLFVFLAGLGIYFQLRRGRDPAAVRRFLWTRGLWLVFCEFTLVALGGDFQWAPWQHSLLAQVIWVLGICMILMAFLVRLRWDWLLGLALALVFGHNLLDGLGVLAWHGAPGGAPGVWAALWIILHQGGLFAPFGGTFPRVYILYPVIPWPGVMALGFCLGRCWDLDAARRRRVLAWLGALCVLGFLAIRAWNRYGDGAPWSPQATPFRTVLSFVNTVKYPPSLLYLLMTLGPGLLLLAWREGRGDNLLDRALATLGRVPMFFYLLQWPVAHGVAVLFHALAGKPWRAVVHFARPYPPDLGFRLGAVYLGWALALALLFPLCRWYAGYKQRHGDSWWVSYL